MLASKNLWSWAFNVDRSWTFPYIRCKKKTQGKPKMETFARSLSCNKSHFGRVFSIGRWKRGDVRSQTSIEIEEQCAKKKWYILRSIYISRFTRYLSPPLICLARAECRRIWWGSASAKRVDDAWPSKGSRSCLKQKAVGICSPQFREHGLKWTLS